MLGYQSIQVFKMAKMKKTKNYIYTLDELS